MEVRQISELINTVTSEVLGDSAVVAEDLSNIVDIGTAVFDANGFDPFTHSLVDKVGKMVFVNRPYTGFAPSVYMDGTTWGNVIQKVGSEIPNAEDNESYELVNNTSYDPFIFHAPSVYEKFYAKYETFAVTRSITQKQLKSAFSGASEMNMFIEMIFNEIEKTFTLKIDALVMRTINNMIGETLFAEYNSGSEFTTASHTKAVNLLYLYNQQFGASLTASDALTTPEFIRFASYVMGVYKDRIKVMSTLFNIGGKQRFTPPTEQRFLMLADFVNASTAYLQSDTFHRELVQLPSAEIVPYWQGSGENYAFDSISSINIKTASNHDVTASGILGVLFDRYSIGVTNVDRWVNTQFNGKADFTNYFYKYMAAYFNDTNENFIVFFVA